MPQKFPEVSITRGTCRELFQPEHASLKTGQASVDVHTLGWCHAAHRSRIRTSTPSIQTFTPSQPQIKDIDVDRHNIAAGLTGHIQILPPSLRLKLGPFLSAPTASTHYPFHTPTEAEVLPTRWQTEEQCPLKVDDEMLLSIQPPALSQFWRCLSQHQYIAMYRKCLLIEKGLMNECCAYKNTYCTYEHCTRCDI